MKIETIRLADVARNLGINPETARARARRAFGETQGRGLPQPIDGWLFLKKDQPKIERMISG